MLLQIPRKTTKHCKTVVKNPNNFPSMLFTARSISMFFHMELKNGLKKEIVSWITGQEIIQVTLDRNN